MTRGWSAQPQGTPAEKNRGRRHTPCDTVLLRSPAISRFTFHASRPVHSLATRNEFLRLRIAGLSFSRIARQLGVSKPTLIAWSRASQPELDSACAEVHDQAQDQISTNA